MRTISLKNENQPNRVEKRANIRRDKRLQQKLRKIFKEDVWKKKWGSTNLAPEQTDYFHSERSVTCLTAYNYLRKHHPKLYPHQVAAAIQAVVALLDSPTGEEIEKSIGVILNGLTQVGKTGAIKAILALNGWLFGEEMKNWPRYIIVISSPAFRALIDQTEGRVDNHVPVGRAALKKTADSALRENEQRDRFDSEEEYMEEEGVRERWMNPRGFEKCAYIPNRAIVIVDEADYGNAKGGILGQILENNKIYLGKSPASWGKKDVKLVFVSATNMAATLATKEQAYFKVVNMLAPAEYYGPHEMLRDGKLHQAIPLKNKTNRKALAHLIDGNYLKKGKTGFIIVRCGTRNSNTTDLLKKDLKAFWPNELSSGSIRIVEINQNTKTNPAVADLCALDGSDYHNPVKGCFWKKPNELVIVVLKNMFGRGVTVSNEHILMCYERVISKEDGLSSVDFTVQSLVGRMSGYSKHCPDIYTDVKAVEEYIDWVNADYSPEVVPSKGNRLRRERGGKYSTLLHLPQITLTDDEKFTLANEIGNNRRPTLERILERNGYTGLVSDFQDADKYPNVYGLPNWEGASIPFRVAIQESLQQSNGTVAKGVKGWFYKKRWAIFIDWDAIDDTKENFSITVVDEKDDLQPDMFAVNTIHHTAAQR